jgi:chromosomal replication initiator protein
MRMEANQAWQTVLGQLQMEMPRASYDTWVRDTRPISYDQGLLTIGVRNAYARDWLESRLSSTVSRLLIGIMNRTVDVEFIVSQNETPESKQKNQAQPVDEEIETLPVQPVSTTLNPRYTFENFVVGSGNRLAHAACQAVAEKPARAYNPLFLYGGVGLGKTHLLHAIGNACVERGLNVLYVSSEEFTNDLINAIRTQTTPAFRDKYRTTDVLLVDDIQFIAGKESTQEEFFHTFNTLHGQDKQIIVSSDRPPKSMVTLEERLRSRFEWGLTADIQPPDLETRQAILRYKAERSGRHVPDEIIEVIAERVQSNIRELEGAFNRIVAFAELSGSPITPKLAEIALADLLPSRDIEPKQIVHHVAEFYKVPTDRLIGRDRSRAVAFPRQVAMYLLRREADISLPQIGKELGGRDHTTVMYAIDKINEMLDSGDERLRKELVQIRQKLHSPATAV